MQSSNQTHYWHHTGKYFWTRLCSLTMTTSRGWSSGHSRWRLPVMISMLNKQPASTTVSWLLLIFSHGPCTVQARTLLEVELCSLSANENHRCWWVMSNNWWVMANTSAAESWPTPVLLSHGQHQCCWVMANDQQMTVLLVMLFNAFWH